MGLLDRRQRLIHRHHLSIQRFDLFDMQKRPLGWIHKESTIEAKYHGKTKERSRNPVCMLIARREWPKRQRTSTIKVRHLPARVFPSCTTVYSHAWLFNHYYIFLKKTIKQYKKAWLWIRNFFFFSGTNKTGPINCGSVRHHTAKSSWNSERRESFVLQFLN